MDMYLSLSAYITLIVIPRWGTMDAEIMASLVATQDYQRFPLSKPAVGQNIALHAMPA